MVTIDRHDDRALYLQLADVLRHDITEGRLGPGDKLPSESELIDQHGISRGTAREAITALRTEGIIVVEHGRGAFVRTTDAPMLRRTIAPGTPLLHYRESFEQEVIEQGRTPTVRETETDTVPPDQALADLLGVRAGTKVRRSRLVCFIDGRPVQIADIHQPARRPKGPATALREELTARAPTRAERRVLQLDDGTPVVEIRRLLRNDDRGLEAASITLVPDRHELTYDSARRTTA